MNTSAPLRFQPGWDTPLVVEHRNRSFLAWLLGIRSPRGECRMRIQGNCPGLDQCHDCAWSGPGRDSA